MFKEVKCSHCDSYATCRQRVRDGEDTPCEEHALEHPVMRYKSCVGTLKVLAENGVTHFTRYDIMRLVGYDNLDSADTMVNRLVATKRVIPVRKVKNPTPGAKGNALFITQYRVLTPEESAAISSTIVEESS